MKKRPTISKSQYIKGLQCPLALWFARKRKDLEPEIDAATQALFDSGYEVGEYAKDYFPGGVEVDTKYWEIAKAVNETESFLGNGEKIIYEATAIHPDDGTYCRVDILKKVDGSEEWDLIEVKSSTSVKDYHIDDVSFQYHVFEGAGFRIRKCYLMHINNQYFREGDINPAGLFHLEDLTEKILECQTKVQTNITLLVEMLEEKQPPSVAIGAHCFNPFECGYREHCWDHVPGFSIYDIYSKTKAEDIYAQTGSFALNDVPPELYPGGKKNTDLLCHINNKTHLDLDCVNGFLQTLEYPLYFLDYETVGSAIPFFDQSRPFQQVPFQFSLHIQQKEDGKTEHHEFLHKEPSDPRRSFAETLLKLCGNAGSVVVYYQSFEKSRNRELGELFPEYQDALESLNNRVADLYVPFGNRWIYHPKQLGSASIKAVLPAFTDLTYKGEKISDGGDASMRYQKFLQGKMNANEKKALWSALSDYCKLDTFAMVRLLKVLRESCV